MGNAATASETTRQKNETNTNAPTSKNRQKEDEGRQRNEKRKKRLLHAGESAAHHEEEAFRYMRNPLTTRAGARGRPTQRVSSLARVFITQSDRSRAFPVPTIFSRFPPSSSGRKLGSEAGLPEIGTPVSKKDPSYLLIPSTSALFLYFFATLKRGTVEVRQNTTPNQRRPSLSGRLTA